jgi:DNA-binding NarL/FixJ family response regulator
MLTQGILIADDHPLFREALKLAVGHVLPGCVIHEADSVASLFAALEKVPQLDLLLLDLNMPGAQGFSALVQARAHYPAVPIIVISGRDDSRIVERTQAHGAAGFVPKSSPPDAIGEAVKAVQHGELWFPRKSVSTAVLDHSEADAATRLATLTPQQFRVLSMVSGGLLNKQIAAELNVSEATIKAHMTAIMQKLGAGNRTQAVLMAQRLSLDQSSLSMASTAMP